MQWEQRSGEEKREETKQNKPGPELAAAPEKARRESCDSTPAEDKIPRVEAVDDRVCISRERMMNTNTKM